MAKLSKFALLSIEDFESHPFGKITFNGSTHSTLAEFYDISEKQIETLFYIQSQLNHIQQIQNVNMETFLSELLELHKVLKSNPDFSNFIISNKNYKLVVSGKFELKLSYQTSKQLTISSSKLNK